MSTCRNGHLLSKVGMIWTGNHYQCLACRRKSVGEAQRRYDGTVRGILTRVKSNAGRRGTR